MSNDIKRYMKDNMFFKKEKTSKTKLLLSIVIVIVVLIICFAENNVKTDFIKQIKNNIENSKKNNEQKVETKKMYNDQFKNLPTWNLTDLYDSLEDERINLDLEELSRIVNDFQTYKGKIKNLNGKELYDVVIEYENIQELMAKLASYSYLKYSEDTSLDENLKFYQKIKEELNNLYTETLFFPLELNKISDARLQQLFRQSKSLAVYKNCYVSYVKERETDFIESGKYEILDKEFNSIAEYESDKEPVIYKENMILCLEGEYYVTGSVSENQKYCYFYDGEKFNLLEDMGEFEFEFMNNKYNTSGLIYNFDNSIYSKIGVISSYEMTN